MAKTYVGYVKREVKDEIDWASIGSGISDMLLAERKAREDKKKEIDDASREFAKVLTEAEGSEHTGINQFFLDGSNSISEIRLMQDRLLKSGQLRLRDYNIQRQNIVDGTNEMLSLVKDYDTKYKEKMARLQNEESAAQEIYQMEQIEGFSNFQNHRLYVNPTNGQISVGKTVPGKGGINELSKNPNDFSTMQALRNRLNMKIDRYDWSKNIQQGVDRIGRIKLVVNKLGVKTREGQKELENYEKSKTDWIDSMMTNSVNVGSMLTDWIGGYSFTQDSFEAGRDDSKILLVPDPRQPSSGNLVPKLSDAQEKIVKERLEQEFDSRVDKIEEAMPVQRTTAYDDRTERQRKIDEQNATSWGQLYYGTPEIQKQAADRLLASPIARKEDLIDIDVRTEPGKVILRYKDSTKDRKIDILDDDGNPIPYSDFVSLGNELHGIDDYGRALQLSGREDAVYNVNRTGRATRAGKAKLYSDPETVVVFKGEKRVPKDIIEEDVDELNEDGVKIVKEVFDVLNLPKPQLKINAGGEEIGPKQTKTGLFLGVTGGKSSQGVTSPSLEITFPNVPPINIPEGEDFQDTLDKIIELIDSSFKSNKKVSVDDIKAAFPTVEMFEIYNPGFTTTEESPKKRTIAQIMKEDDLTREEAVKIFKAQ